MAAPIRPAATKTYAREKWVFVPTIANTTAPTAAEVTGATTLDISCFLLADSGKPAQNTNRVTLARRLCDAEQFETIGTTTYTGGTARYAVNPQAAAASDGKKAYEKFPEGTVGFLVRRFGIDVDTDLAAGQFVDVFPCEFGPGMPTSSSDGEEGEVIIMQDWAVTNRPKFIVAITS